MAEANKSKLVPWVASAGAVIFAALALFAGTKARRFVSSQQSLTEEISAGHAPAAPVFLDIASVANSANVGGDALVAAARAGINAAVAGRAEVSTTAPTAQLTNTSLQGHYIDAAIQSVTAEGDRSRVTVAVIVSAWPRRAYEFESTMSATVNGAPDNVAMISPAVQAAMRAATVQAIEQMLRRSP